MDAGRVKTPQCHIYLVPTLYKSSVHVTRGNDMTLEKFV